MLFLSVIACILLVANGQFMTGGLHQQSVNDPDAVKYACAAVDVLNSQVEGGVLQVLVGIKSYTTQVVNGVVHKVSFYVAESACSAGQVRSFLDLVNALLNVVI
ncbi:unnamed protein product [Soboliphyme baturini]|uniref:Cystatin domain-containing protein n=1 Tax=Soboliphyme baturini TaxID=241478 RepID=A0A183I9U8_9BILA|nr:unnamed protein product [Soboliphyme baturini]